MISKDISIFCKDYWKIENYEQAVNDNENMWHCHHRLGEVFTEGQLIAGHNYYNVEPECLIFLTRDEHRKKHYTHPTVFSKRFRKHKTNTSWRGRKLIQRKNK